MAIRQKRKPETSLNIDLEGNVVKNYAKKINMENSIVQILFVIKKKIRCFKIPP